MDHGPFVQNVSLLVHAEPDPVAMPLASRVHEGVRRSPTDRATVPMKMAALVLTITAALGVPVLFAGDAYYANRTMIDALVPAGHHVLSRVRLNTVAYEPVPEPKRRRRGRPRKYGRRVELKKLWSDPGFQQARARLYGKKTKFRYLVRNLAWPPARTVVRFILVESPGGGHCILMSTKLDLDPALAVQTYSYRFKIETGFKQARHTIGAYAYHFWTKDMPPIHRGDGDQYLHRATRRRRRAVAHKIRTYDLHAQLGCIAQGLLLYLGVREREAVWDAFRSTSWQRTMHVNATPSVAVAAQALRGSLPTFLRGNPEPGSLGEFLHSRMDWSRAPGGATP
ncbi:MAG: transposase [Thermoplasmatota archaeon]